MTSALALAGVTKRYEQGEALTDVSFEVPGGQVVALLGPNGAGKTTTVDLLTGLRRPSAGEVTILGAPPRSRAARSRCGVMLQESTLPEALRVAEVVRLFRSYYPRPLPVDDVLERAGLTEVRDTPAARLSGGQRRRVCYALALCGDPEVLLLDEPTVGLDVGSRLSFLSAIEASAAAGTTVLLSTHYLEEVDRLAERVLVLDEGRIIADERPEDIRRRFPSRRISFDFHGSVDDLPTDDLPVHSSQVENGQAKLLSNDPREVLSGLITSGLALDNLEVTGANLEEAFLALTTKEPVHERD